MMIDEIEIKFAWQMYCVKMLNNDDFFHKVHFKLCKAFQ